MIKSIFLFCFSMIWGLGGVCFAQDAVRVEDVADLRGEEAERLVVFSGVKAGDFNPDKMSNWNRYKYTVMTGGNSEASRLKGNVYASALLKDKTGAVDLLYHGIDHEFGEQRTDRIYLATSPDFLSRKDPRVIAPPTWTKHGIAFNEAPSAFAIGDPSVVRIDEGLKTERVHMLFSAARPVTSLSANLHIGWATINQLRNSRTWWPHSSFFQALSANQRELCEDRGSYKWALFSFCRRDEKLPKDPIDNRIIVRSARDVQHEITAMHRPSLVYDKNSKLFHLYFDQASIKSRPMNPRGEQDWIRAHNKNAANFDPVAEFESNVSNRIANDCDQSGPNACEFDGGVIRHAVSADGRTFFIDEPKKKRFVVRAVSPEAKNFKGGWIMFADIWKNQSSLDAVRSDADIKSIVGTFVSSDGVTYKEVFPIATFEEYILPTNVTIISEGNSLRGIMYGAFKKTDEAFECPAPYRKPQWGDICIVQGSLEALFLQKQIRFTAPGCQLQKAVALDEDRIQLRLQPATCPGGVPNEGMRGVLEVYDTDGHTLLFKNENFFLKKGRLYRVS